jgi:predicted nucleic acid-binding protein
MVILDTNVLSALIKDEPDPVVAGWLDGQADVSVWTTVISIFEIRYGLAIMPAGRRQSLMVAAFERTIEETLEGRVLLFDHPAAEQAALLMVRRKSAGRPIDLRDTMIGGIVVAQRATIATRNVRHFSDLDAPVVDPWGK